MTYQILWMGFPVGTITTYAATLIEELTEKGYVLVWDGKQ